MQDYFRKKTWVITTLMFIIAFGSSFAIVYYEFGFSKNIKFSRADASNNMSGYAWSANVGWVSFNCTNDDSCGVSNYGTSLDSVTSHFSGYAWNSSVGWISFNETTPPDNYSFNTNCKTSGSCNSSNNCTACYNPTDNKVYGWAKILSLGDNGWIKFNDAWTNGVSIDSDSGSLIGYAWNGNDDGSGIGWLSFSCDNESSCGTSDYRVLASFSSRPSATNLTAPNWSFAQAGQYGALQAKLGWIFNDADAGASESAYQIIANTSNSISSPIFDSGKCLGYNNPTNKCIIDIGVGQLPLDSAITLTYNTPYYWWVKVWDNTNTSSSLTQYNSDQDTPAEADDGSPLTFTTYKHEMPDVNFNQSPTSPAQGQDITFSDNSQVYLNAAPSAPVNCSEALCDWEWSVVGDATIANPTASTTKIVVNSPGGVTVTLKVTDNEGYYTLFSKAININNQAPNWKEVKSR